MASDARGPRSQTHAHPGRRREPLPWQSPKPSSDDATAPTRLERILSSPTYRRADEDVEFLNTDDTRGIRLEVEYLKPELLLKSHGIEHSVVVFGSTRLIEPSAAKRRVAGVKRQLADSPGDPELSARLSRAERILALSHYYDEAREFGRLVAESGEGPADCRLVVVTGGGPGAMEAANRGADDAGSKTVGLNIDLPHEQYPNPYVTPELCFRFQYFALRKLHFLLRARALVAFPGGFGTLDELFETLTLIQTRKVEPLPVVLVGEEFWRRAVDIDFLTDEGMIDPEDRDLFWFAETAKEAWHGITAWYANNGEDLFECR